MTNVAFKTPVALYGNVEAMGFGRSRLMHVELLWSCTAAEFPFWSTAEAATTKIKMETWRRERGILDHIFRLNDQFRTSSSTGRDAERGDRSSLKGMAA